MSASYEYYTHGPLARTILGKLKVQGLDHAYTLQGWLNGVNPAMGSLTNCTDPTEAKPVTRMYLDSVYTTTEMIIK